MESSMNIFRCTPDNSLDKQFLRVCAVHRLLDRGRVTKARAIELLAQRKVQNPQRLVEFWAANPKLTLAA